MLIIRIGKEVQHARHPGKTFTITGIKSPTQVLLRCGDQYMLSSTRQLHDVEESGIRGMNDYERFVYEKVRDVERSVVDEMIH